MRSFFSPHSLMKSDDDEVGRYAADDMHSDRGESEKKCHHLIYEGLRSCCDGEERSSIFHAVRDRASHMVHADRL